MSTDLRSLSHESLVAAVSGRLGGTPSLTATELDSWYVRDASVPAARIETYPRRRRVHDVIASMADSIEAAARPAEVSYASFFVEPEAAEVRGGRRMAVAS
jgi:hypothetical protein